MTSRFIARRTKKKFSDFGELIRNSSFFILNCTLTRIGLISDTHGYLDPTVAQHFAQCDEIWHAGDIGDLALIEKLAEIKPVKAVFGNIDDHDMQLRYPEDLWLDVEGLLILITHIAGAPPHYNPRLKRILKQKSPDILICGHSHILKIMRDKERNLVFINPGAAGQQGFHHMRTLVRFTLHEKEIKDMEVIELGKRGTL